MIGSRWPGAEGAIDGEGKVPGKSERPVPCHLPSWSSSAFVSAALPAVPFNLRVRFLRLCDGLNSGFEHTVMAVYPRSF